ncbi:hypothetical protein [Catelliglobosispora koreensis]|uniref:hypothetical protein n=1 Tax=Catelliglobosispora koreensis TaxID=129052 RepID=UPI00035CB08F|nr:hypothetical protein [Catelliglobosispora koreensis]
MTPVLVALGVAFLIFCAVIAARTSQVAAGEKWVLDRRTNTAADAEATDVKYRNGVSGGTQ